MKRPRVKDCIKAELANGPDTAFKLFRRLQKVYLSMNLNTVAARCYDMRNSGELVATKGRKGEWIYSLPQT